MQPMQCDIAFVKKKQFEETFEKSSWGKEELMNVDLYKFLNWELKEIKTGGLNIEYGVVSNHQSIRAGVAMSYKPQNEILQS